MIIWLTDNIMTDSSSILGTFSAFSNLKLEKTVLTQNSLRDPVDTSTSENGIVLLYSSSMIVEESEISSSKWFRCLMVVRKILDTLVNTNLFTLLLGAVLMNRTVFKDNQLDKTNLADNPVYVISSTHVRN
jgi:hypothetical protein